MRYMVSLHLLTILMVAPIQAQFQRQISNPSPSQKQFSTLSVSSKSSEKDSLGIPAPRNALVGALVAGFFYGISTIEIGLFGIDHQEYEEKRRTWQAFNIGGVFGAIAGGTFDYRNTKKRYKTLRIIGGGLAGGLISYHIGKHRTANLVTWWVLPPLTMSLAMTL